MRRAEKVKPPPFTVRAGKRFYGGQCYEYEDAFDTGYRYWRTRRVEGCAGCRLCAKRLRFSL